MRYTPGKDSCWIVTLAVWGHYTKRQKWYGKRWDAEAMGLNDFSFRGRDAR